MREVFILNFKHKCVMLILLLLLICLSVGSVSASEDASGVSNTTTVLSESIGVDSGNDVVGGLESSVPEGDVLGADGDGTFTDLQNDINDAVNTGSVFNMNRSYIYTAGVDGEDLLYGVVVNGPLIINGNGTYYIDGAGVARIMQIKADNVEVNKVTFQNGYRAFNTNDFQGAAVYCENFNNLTFNTCKFTGNGQTVFYPGTTTRALALGLCIYANVGSNLNISDCTFTGVAGTGVNTGVGCFNVNDTTIYCCTFICLHNGIYVVNGNMINMTRVAVSTSASGSYGGNVTYNNYINKVLNILIDHCNMGGTGTGNRFTLTNYLIYVRNTEYINVTNNNFHNFNGGYTVLDFGGIKYYAYIYNNIINDKRTEWNDGCRDISIAGVRSTANIDFISNTIQNTGMQRSRCIYLSDFNNVLFDHFTLNAVRETSQEREGVYCNNINNFNP